MIAAQGVGERGVLVVSVLQIAGHRHLHQIPFRGGARTALRAVEVELIHVAQLVIEELRVQRGQHEAMVGIGREFELAAERIGFALQLILAKIEQSRRAGFVVVELVVVGLLLHHEVRAGDDDAPALIAPAQACRVLFLVAVRQIDVAQAEIEITGETGVVERRKGLDVDATGQRLGRHVRRQRLVEHDRIDQRCRHGIEPEDALLGAEDVDSVEGDRCPARRRAAHLDVALLPLVALHGHRRQARQRGGGRGIREAADRVRGDHIDDVLGGLLALQRFLDTVLDRRRRDDDLFEHGRIARLLRRGYGYASHRPDRKLPEQARQFLPRTRKRAARRWT